MSPLEQYFRYPGDDATAPTPRSAISRIDVVDTQVHLDCVPEQAIATMDAVGVQAMLADEFWGYDQDVPLPGYKLPNGAKRATPALSLWAANLHPDRFAFLVRVDHNDPDIAGFVRQIAASPYARALRVGVRTQEEVAALAAGDYGPLFRAAAECNLPVFVHMLVHLRIETLVTPLLAPYAAEISDLRLVIDHAGTPRTAEWYDAALRLGEQRNVWMKWCHEPFYFSRWVDDKESVLTYPFPGLQPYLERALASYGRERIVWASDHTKIQTGHTWAESLFYLRDAPYLSEEDKIWILGRSARELLNWPKTS